MLCPRWGKPLASTPEHCASCSASRPALTARVARDDMGRAPFWSYVVILLVVVLGGEAVRARALGQPAGSALATVPATDAFVARESPIGVAAAVPLGPPPTPAAAEPAGAGKAASDNSRWELSFGVDPMTDRRTLRAVTLAAPSERSPYVYRLATKCDGEYAQWSLAAFDAGKGRPLPFELSVTGASPVMSRGFRYRFDDSPQESSILVQTDYANEGRVEDRLLLKLSETRFSTGHALLGQSTEQVKASVGESKNIGPWRPSGVGESGTRWSYGNLPPFFAPKLDVVFKEGVVAEVTERRVTVLPKQRLLVADVFPDETVEFSFASLSDADRTTLATTCFPAMFKD